MAMTRRQARVAEQYEEMRRMSWAYDPEVLEMARGIKNAMETAPPVEGVLVGHESAMAALYQQYNRMTRLAMGALYFTLGFGAVALAHQTRNR